MHTRLAVVVGLLGLSLFLGISIPSAEADTHIVRASEDTHATDHWTFWDNTFQDSTYSSGSDYTETVVMYRYRWYPNSRPGDPEKPYHFGTANRGFLQFELPYIEKPTTIS